MFILVLFLSYINVGFRESLLGVAWPSIKMNLQVPDNYLGLVVISIYFGMMSSSFLFTYFKLWQRSNKLLCICSFIGSFILFAIQILNNFWILIFVYFIFGLSCGLIDIMLNSYIASYNKANYITLLQCFYGFGTIIGPAVMAFCINKGWNYSECYTILSVFQFVIFVFTLLIYNKWPIIDYVSKRETMNMKKISKYDFLPLFILLSYCSFDAFSGLWSNTYLVSFKMISEVNAAIIVSCIYGGLTIGRIISSIILKYVEDKQMIVYSKRIILLSLIMIIFGRGNICLLFSFFVYGLGISSIYPVTIHITSNIYMKYGPDQSAKMVSIQMAFGYIGCSLITSLLGFALSYVGYKYTYVVISGIFITYCILDKMLFKCENKI